MYLQKVAWNKNFLRDLYLRAKSKDHISCLSPKNEERKNISLTRWFFPKRRYIEELKAGIFLSH